MQDDISTDILVRIWFEQSGDRIEIGPDADGLVTEIVEIKYIGKGEKVESALILERMVAEILHAQLGRYLELTKR